MLHIFLVYVKFIPLLIVRRHHEAWKNVGLAKYF